MSDTTRSAGLRVRILDTTIQQTGRWIGIETRRLELPSGDPIEVEVVRFPDIALIIAVNDNRLVLVRQFRFPPHEWIIEAPAGRVETDEDPRVTATRELAEETGFQSARLEKIGEIRISPHLSTELTHVYRAFDLVQGSPHPEKGELLEIMEVPLAELRHWVRSSRINDAKTIAALVLAELI